MCYPSKDRKVNFKNIISFKLYERTVNKYRGLSSLETKTRTTLCTTLKP